MRRLLEGIYSGAAVLAALCMVLLLLAVLLSIASRQLNFQAPGIDAYAGYLAGAGFLALAHTLKRGEHIRVTLILNLLRGRWKKRMELWALGAASLLALLFAFYSCKLAWQSHVFNDISTGNDATPLWLPQIAMALGTVVLAIAFVDELVLEMLDRREQVQSSEALRNE